MRNTTKIAIALYVTGFVMTLVGFAVPGLLMIVLVTIFLFSRLAVQTPKKIIDSEAAIDAANRQKMLDAGGSEAQAMMYVAQEQTRRNTRLS